MGGPARGRARWSGRWPSPCWPALLAVAADLGPDRVVLVDRGRAGRPAVDRLVQRPRRPAPATARSAAPTSRWRPAPLAGRTGARRPARWPSWPCVPLSLACGLRGRAWCTWSASPPAGPTTSASRRRSGRGLPYAVAFGGLPGLRVAGRPAASSPPWVPVAGALLGVGAHLRQRAARPRRRRGHRRPRAAAPAGRRAASRSSRRRCSSPPRSRSWSAPGAARRRRRLRSRSRVVAALAVVALLGRGRAPFRAAIGIALVDVVLLVAVAMSRPPRPWDLVVVGAGPAGAATALGRAGRRPAAAGAAARPRRLPARQVLRRRHRAARARRARRGRRRRRRRRLDAAAPARARPRRAAGSAAADAPGRCTWSRAQVFDARLVEHAAAAGARAAPAPGPRVDAAADGVVLDDALPRPGAGRRRRRALRRRRRRLGRRPRPPGAGDPRLRARRRRARAARQVIRLRRPPPAVVRLGLRPRRRPVQRRLRRAARHATDPPSRGPCCSTSSSGCSPGAVADGDRWRGHHLPLSGWRWRPARRPGAADRRRGRRWSTR